MSLLFPAAWGLLLFAIPIVALYLIRTRLERRAVATLLFWEQLRAPSAHSALWRKLRRWISLLLQILFLLLLVFALLRPEVAWRAVAPAYTVFVLDNTASMSATVGGTSRNEEARTFLAQHIGNMRPFDRAAIVATGTPPRLLSGWSANGKDLLAALATLPAPAGSAAAGPALALAENLARTQPEATILFLSDSEPPTGSNIKSQIVGSTQPNLGITGVTARRSLSSPQDVRLQAEIISHFEEPTSGTLEVLRDGQLIDTLALTLAPHVPWKRHWDFRSTDAATYGLRLQDFPADGFAADDAAEVILPALATARVVLVSDHNAYLEAALNALPLTEWVRVEEGALPEFPDVGALYIWNRTSPPPDFKSAHNLLIAPPTSGFWGTFLGPLAEPLISDTDEDVPILRHAGFANVRLDAGGKWKPASAAKVYAESFGDPVIFGTWQAADHWLLLGFDLDSSDLVLRTAFPILLGNLVEAMRPSLGISSSAVPGAKESLLIMPGHSVSQPATPKASPLPALPLWTWAIFLAALWLVIEWWLCTRRITE